MTLLFILPLFFALMGGVLFAMVCICAKKQRSVSPADCIIVPGARVWEGGRLGASLENRCLRAIELRCEGYAQAIILCGGQQGMDAMVESLAMRRYMEQKGIADHLYEDPDSLTTYENLRNAMRIMRAQGFLNAIIVSNDYHVQRIKWIARDIGMQACVAKAASPDWSKLYWKVRMKECMSWIMYFLRKYTKKDR